MAHNFQNCIEIYLRLGPVSRGVVAEYELDQEAKTVEWLVPRQVTAGMTNHQREKYNFSFSGIFGIDAKQDVIFDTVARKVVLLRTDLLLQSTFLCKLNGSFTVRFHEGSAHLTRLLVLSFVESSRNAIQFYHLWKAPVMQFCSIICGRLS